MRVAILYNAIPEGASLEDQDLRVQVEAVALALRRLGHEPTSVSCTLDLTAMREDLARLRPDVVFNLVESLAEADSLVYLPHAVLDVLGLPYAGNRTEALFSTTHKLLAKQWLQNAGLPTAPWIEETVCQVTQAKDARFLLGQGTHGDRRPDRPPASVLPSRAFQPPSPPAPLPKGEGSSFSPETEPASWIIKGIWEQASRGMDDDAVIDRADRAAVRERLRQRFAQSGRPCFAEQFIEGREFNLSVVTSSGGPQVLPPAEIDFSAFPPGKPRIVGHRAKWQSDSFEYNNTPRRFDFAPAERSLSEELQSLAERCWTLFRLRGWARVDFRVDAAGRPWILEVNANPCLSPDAGFAAALQQAGIPFEEAIQRILQEAVPDAPESP